MEVLRVTVATAVVGRVSERVKETGGETTWGLVWVRLKTSKHTHKKTNPENRENQDPRVRKKVD